ncbi:MAG: TetR/AcrR family transcriptional regulator [Terracidiphilus sp.]
MSGNADPVPVNPVPAARANASSRPVDRRVRHTRDVLGDALLELMQEKEFDEITVQHVLDRAGVGRSTFYAHYSDKNDLFLSDVEDFFEVMSTLLTRKGAPLDRVAPVCEFATHIGEVRELYSTLVAAGKMRDVLELGQGFFARSIEERLRMADVELAPMLLKARAQALAGAMLALLTWWVDHGSAASPEELDAQFHQMVWSGIRPGPR